MEQPSLFDTITLVPALNTHSSTADRRRAHDALHRVRICQECGGEYTRAQGGRVKYCSRVCMAEGNRLTRANSSLPRCELCGVASLAYRRPTTTRAYWCRECTDPIAPVLERLRRHHVATDRVRLLLLDHGCELCKVDMVTPHRDRATGRAVPLLTVDHDHTCCPGDKSCGRCVRGLVCYRCNTLLGMALNEPSTLRAAAAYLERARGVDPWVGVSG